MNKDDIQTPLQHLYDARDAVYKLEARKDLTPEQSMKLQLTRERLQDTIDMFHRIAEEV